MMLRNLFVYLIQVNYRAQNRPKTEFGAFEKRTPGFGTVFFFTFATGMKKSQLNGKKTHVVEHSKELREVTNFFLMLLVITRTILTICELLPFFNRLVIN